LALFGIQLLMLLIWETLFLALRDSRVQRVHGRLGTERVQPPGHDPCDCWIGDLVTPPYGPFGKAITMECARILGLPTHAGYPRLLGLIMTCRSACWGARERRSGRSGSRLRALRQPCGNRPIGGPRPTCFTPWTHCNPS